MYELYTDAYLECLIRSDTLTYNHHTGTCAMGSCVDENLRVLGVQNLRDIDTSIMSKIVSGNTNAPAVMIGEKGADLILNQEWFEREGWQLKAGRSNL